MFLGESNSILDTILHTLASFLHMNCLANSNAIYKLTKKKNRLLHIPLFVFKVNININIVQSIGSFNMIGFVL